MKSERCVIHLMDAGDLERSAHSPALAGLVASGWTVMAHLMVETTEGSRVALLLGPPTDQEKFPVSKIVIPIVFAILIHGATLSWLLM